MKCLCFGWRRSDRPYSPSPPSQYNGVNKIQNAARAGNLAEVRSILFDGEIGVNDRDEMNRTALHCACAFGHLEVVKLLIKMKCDTDLRDSDNRTALIKAAQCQEEKCAMILLESGADPNVMDSSGNTPLHYAVYSKNTLLASKLLLHNARIEAKNKEGFTPLLLSLRENREHMARFLIQKGANIHTTDLQGRTALMLAAKYQSGNIVSLLLRRGIDVFSEDCYGWTALFYAVDNDCNLKIIASAHEEKKCAIFKNKKSAGFAVISEKQTRPGGQESKQSEVKEQRTKLGSREINSSMKCDGVTAGPAGLAGPAGPAGSAVVIQHRKSTQPDNLLPTKEKEHDQPTRNTSTDKKKVSKQTNAVDDLNDLTQVSETASGDCELHYPDYENILLLIEQLKLECKESASLLKIQNAVHLCNKLTKSCCERHKEKNKKMENTVSALQKELSETKNAISHLKYEKVHMETELFKLRSSLRAEEQKRRWINQFCERAHEELKERQEEHEKEVEMRQELEYCLGIIDLDLKNVRHHLNEVIEERNYIQRQLSQEQNERNLLHEILAHNLCNQKKVGIAVEKLSSQVDELIQKLETSSSNCAYLEKENEFLWQKLVSLKGIKRICKKLTKEKKKLEEEMLSLKSQIENTLECAQAEEHNCANEEREGKS